MSPRRRLDPHFHVIPPFFRDAVYSSGSGPAIGRYPEWSPELALEIMDRFDIAAAITSLAQPGVGFLPPAEAAALARRCNDYAADLNARWPKRFGAFCTVPMADIKGAVDETVRSLDQLKFSGVSLFASYDGQFLGDPAFDPVMSALNERDAVVFVHPGTHLTNKLIQLPWPGFMMEYLFDTTRAVVNLMFGGALQRFPRIRFILPHAGGLVPYFSWRLSVSPMIDPRLPQLSQDEVFASLKRFWYDNALSASEPAWGCLQHIADPGRIVFGSDWPFANARVTTEAIKSYEALPLPLAQRDAIDRGNALKLFPQFA